jgi:hypothetical protein
MIWGFFMRKLRKPKLRKPVAPPAPNKVTTRMVYDDRNGTRVIVETEYLETSVPFVLDQRQIQLFSLLKRDWGEPVISHLRSK